VSKINSDQMYEIQPIKISVKNEKNKNDNTNEFKLSHRSRSQNALINQQRNNSKNNDILNKEEYDKNIVKANWQVADYNST
jgi:hypothetical protein